MYKMALPIYVNKTNSNIAFVRTVNTSIKLVSVVESVYTTDLKSVAYLRLGGSSPPTDTNFFSIDNKNYVVGRDLYAVGGILITSSQVFTT